MNPVDTSEQVFTQCNRADSAPSSTRDASGSVFKSNSLPRKNTSTVTESATRASTQCDVANDVIDETQAPDDVHLTFHADPNATDISLPSKRSSASCVSSNKWSFVAISSSKYFRNFLIFFAFLVGVLNVIQAAMNVKTSTVFRDSIRSSLYSFLEGTLILFIIVYSNPQMRQFVPLLCSRRSLHSYLVPEVMHVSKANCKREHAEIQVDIEMAEAKTPTEIPLTHTISHKQQDTLLSHGCDDSPRPDSNLIELGSGKQWHMYTGGLLGALYVTSTIYLVQYLGYAVTFVLSVTGQLFVSLRIDQVGFLGSPIRPLNKWKLLGMLITIVGAVLIQDYSTSINPGEIVGLAICAFINGCLLPLQAAINRDLCKVAVSPIVVTFYSFWSGTILMFFASLVTIAFDDFNFVNLGASDAWIWFPGFLGVIYVSSSIVISPIIGFASFFVATIAGQLIFSFLNDNLGIFNDSQSYSAGTLAMHVVGILLAICGSAVIARENQAYDMRMQQNEAKQKENGEENESAQLKNATDDKPRAAELEHKVQVCASKEDGAVANIPAGTSRNSVAAILIDGRPPVDAEPLKGCSNSSSSTPSPTETEKNKASRAAECKDDSPQLSRAATPATDS